MEKPPLFLKLWVWMLLNASHKDYGKLKRGQLFTSIDRMREAMSFRVGSRIERPTRKQVRTVYNFLTDSDAIQVVKVTHGMIITLLNYDEYQNPSHYEGHKENSESPFKGIRNGRPKGTGDSDITGCNNETICELNRPEGHAEGHAENPGRGTIKTKRHKTRKNIIPGDFSFLMERYSDKLLIDQAFEAIRSTRKSGKVADSVLRTQLQKWQNYPVDQVQSGIRIYLEKGYAMQGKDEKYLLGIIRNQKPEQPAETSTGSSLLDAYYARKGF